MDNRKETIKDRYRRGVNQYDALLSTQSIWAKLACRLVWGFPDTAYTDGLLARLPDDFTGKLLDIPVGTGLFTAPKYQRMNHADITCVDYSPDMMEKAQEKFDCLGIHHIRCMQGDIGALSFEDSSFDAILTMNGFHAFPDKEAAWREIYRILRPKGFLLGCFYIAKENSRTDWFIRNLYTPKGYFTPPFEDKNSLMRRLVEKYTHVELWNIGSIVCFHCIK